MGLGIGVMIKNLISIAAYFFNPKLREKREREGVWNEFKSLEEQYAQAMADCDPGRAALLDKQLRDLRSKHKYLNI